MNLRHHVALLPVLAAVGIGVSSFVGVGCQPPASPNGPATYFTIRTEGHSAQLRLDGHRLYGPNTDLNVVEPGAIRGRWMGTMVDLRVTSGQVEGTIDNQRTELHARRDPNGTVVAQGLVRGQLSNFTVSDSEFAGVTGVCGVQLTKQSAGAYGGRRACSSRVGFSTVELPRTWSELGAEEAALYLVLTVTSIGG